MSELRKLRRLEDENARLRHIVADLTLDKQIPHQAGAASRHLLKLTQRLLDGGQRVLDLLRRRAAVAAEQPLPASDQTTGTAR